MAFEWDSAKNEANVIKHGVSFSLACDIFKGAYFTARDARKNYGEVRDISIGKASDAVILVVVHTDRRGTTRIISARRANRKERDRYEKELKDRASRQW